MKKYKNIKIAILLIVCISIFILFKPHFVKSGNSYININHIVSMTENTQGCVVYTTRYDASKISSKISKWDCYRIKHSF